MSKVLVEKLAEVMALVNRVPKRGRNDFHKYDYATEADIVEAVRGALSERSILLVPSVQSCVREGDITHAMVTFTFTNGEDAISFDIAASGQDKGDKGAYKAMTGAVKYALLKFFLIPTGDDPEKEEKDAPRRKAAENRPPFVEAGTRLRRGDPQDEEMARNAGEPPPVGETHMEPRFVPDALKTELATFQRRMEMCVMRHLVGVNNTPQGRKKFLTAILARDVKRIEDVSLEEFQKINEGLKEKLDERDSAASGRGGASGTQSNGALMAEGSDTNAARKGDASRMPPVSAPGPDRLPSNIEMDAIRRAWFGAIARAAGADVSVGPIHASVCQGTDSTSSEYRRCLLEQLLRRDVASKDDVSVSEWQEAIKRLNDLAAGVLPLDAA